MQGGLQAQISQESGPQLQFPQLCPASFWHHPDTWLPFLMASTPMSFMLPYSYQLWFGGERTGKLEK